MSQINCSNSRESSIREAQVHCDACTLLLCTWCIKNKDGKDYCYLCYADLFSKKSEDNPHDITAEENEKKIGKVVRVKKHGKMVDAVIFPSGKKIMILERLEPFDNNVVVFEHYVSQLKNYIAASKMTAFVSTTDVLNSLFDKSIEKQVGIVNPTGAKEDVITGSRVRKVLEFFQHNNQWEKERRNWLRDTMALKIGPDGQISSAVSELQASIASADNLSHLPTLRATVKEIIEANRGELLDRYEEREITREHIHRTIRRIDREVRREQRGGRSPRAGRANRPSARRISINPSGLTPGDIETVLVDGTAGPTRIVRSREEEEESTSTSIFRETIEEIEREDNSETGLTFS